MFKKLIKSLGYFMTIVLGGCLFLTIFNYFNILSLSFIGTLKFLLPIIAIATASFILGKSSLQKGYIEGAKLGSLVILMFLLISVVTKTFDVKSLIYYLIILLVSILSSMVGINKKRRPASN